MSLALCLLLCVLVSASAAVFRARAHSGAARATFLFIIGASGSIPVLVFAWRAPPHAAERLRVLGREWYDAAPFVVSGVAGTRGDLTVTRPVMLTLASAGATATVRADSASEADAVRVNGVPLNGIQRDATRADSVIVRLAGAPAPLVVKWTAVRLAGRCSESSIGRWQRLTGIRPCALGLTTTANGSTRQDTLVAGSTKLITAGGTRIRIQLESVKRRISLFVDPSRVSDIGGVDPARAALADSITIDRAEDVRVAGAEGRRRVSIDGPLYGPLPATSLSPSSAMLIGSGIDSAGGMLDVIALERFGAVSGSDAVTLSASTDAIRQVNGAAAYSLRRWFGTDTLSSANVAIGTQRRFLIAIEHAGVRALAIGFLLAFLAWGFALSRLRAIPFRTSGKSAAMVIGIISALIGLGALVAIRLATQFPLDFEAALTTLRMLALALLSIGTVCLNRDLLSADTRRRGVLQLIIPTLLMSAAAILVAYVARASTVEVIVALVRDGLIALTMVAGVNALFPIRAAQTRTQEAGSTSEAQPVGAKSMLPLYLLALPAVLPSALVELHFTRRSIALNIGAAVTVIVALLVITRTRAARHTRTDHASQSAANATYAIAMLAALAGSALLAVGQTVIAFRFLAGLGLLLGFVRIFAARWAPSIHAGKPTSALDLFGREPTLAILQQFAYFLLLALTDRGALLLWASCATAVVATALLMPDHKRMQAAALVGVLMLTAVMYVVQVVSREDAANPAVALSTAKIRFAAAHFPEALERRIFAAPVEQASETMNALVQIWGARAFSGAGGTTGRPFLQGPFRRDAPIESKIATTDNAFAVLVLGDHGLLGGYTVLALLVSLAALLLVVASSSLVESWRRLPEALELLVLAFFLAVPALYLTAANVGAVSLTGQNVPFLGMRGATEALVSTVLILFVIGALLRIGRLTITEKTPADLKNYGKSRRLTRTMAVSIVLMVGLSVVVSAKAYSWVHEGRGARAQYASAMMNRYQPRVLQDALEATFAKGESLGASLSLRPGRQDESLAALDTNPGSYGAAVARYVGAGRASGLVGCTRPEDLRIASGDWASARRSVRDLCTQVATVRAPWRGWIREGVRGDTLVLWHRRTAVRLAGDAAHANDYCVEVSVVGRRDVQKGPCGAAAAGAAVDRFTVQVGADGTARVTDGGEGVTVDGRTLAVPRTIRAGSVIAVRCGHPFVVDVLRGGARAAGRIINGQWTSVQRASTDSLALVMHRALSSAWRGGVPSAFADTVVTLSLDWTLHEDIAAAMRPLCEGSLGQGLVRFRTCAATIINARSGAVLAMPDWSNDSGLTALRAPNQNLREHVIGSATKPLIAAAVLRSYPALASMVVSETEQPQLVAGWNVTAPVVWEGGRTIAFTEFVQRSRNAFLQPLLFLGATVPNASLPPFEPQPQGLDSRIAINGRAVGAQRPTLALKRAGGCMVLDGEHTAVGSGLRTLFDVRLRNSDASGPGLWAEGLSDKTFSLEAMRAADAEPSTVALADLQGEVRRGGCGTENSIALGLRNFGFGTYGNRWSNIKLAEAAGRIATGIAARAHVMRDSGVASAVKGLDIRADARMSVVRAMKAAVDSGTVFNGLRGTPAAHHGEWMIGKTGTIDYGMRTTKYTSMLLFAIGIPDEPSCVVAGAVWIEMDAQHGDLSEPVGLATELFGRAIYPALHRAKYSAATRAQCRR